MLNFENAEQIMVEVICGDATTCLFDIDEFDVEKHEGSISVSNWKGNSVTFPANTEWIDEGDEYEAVLTGKINDGCKVRISWQR